MDTNATTTQDQQHVQPAGRIQAPVSRPPQVNQPRPNATPSSISGGKESEPSAFKPENASDMNNQEVQSARQEVPTTPEQQNVEAQADTETQIAVESAEQSAEIEKFVEASPDVETPDIPKEVQKAGVTHSGPGMIIDENSFGVTAMPMTYEQAAEEEKQTKFKDSRHWLLAQIMYVWRKLNPQYGKMKGGAEMRSEK